MKKTGIFFLGGSKGLPLLSGLDSRAVATEPWLDGCFACRFERKIENTRMRDDLCSVCTRVRSDEVDSLSASL